MKNENLPLLSSIYKRNIDSFFKNWIKNYFDISNLGLFIILPNKEILYLSTRSELSEVYSSRNFFKYDLILKSEMYENYNIYPWRTKKSNKYIEEINLTREKIFGMYSGTTFVRKLHGPSNDLFFLIYCVSTYNKDPLMKYIYACFSNEILEICDFAYNHFLNIFQRYTFFELPKISNFVGLDKSEKSIFENYPGMRLPNTERLLKFIESFDKNNKNAFNFVSTLAGNQKKQIIV